MFFQFSSFSILLILITVHNCKTNQNFLEDNLKLHYLENLPEHIVRYSLHNDGIQPGMAYSTDTQTFGKTVCYKTESILKTGQSSTLQFNEAVDYSTMLRTFNAEYDVSSGYGIFSANAMFNYMRSLEEDSYSLSINYFQKVYHRVEMTFSYDPENILNEVGKNIYKNGTNPMFRLICGDTLVTSYEEGAALLTSMKIKFNSREEKTQFQSKVGVNVGSFISASMNINSAASKYNLNGQIEISAFQLGGDPTQLSKLLALSVVNCDIKNIQACQDTAKGIIDYVSNTFPSQFNKDEHGVWTSSLVPLNNFERDYVVSDFGLILAPSFVDEEVEKDRKNLVTVFKMFDYYKKNLELLLMFYPVKLSSEFLRIKEELALNLDFLTNGDGLHKAIDCFSFPYKCKDVYTSLISKIDPNLEANLNDRLSKLQYYSHFHMTFSGVMCLPPDWAWQDSWALNIKDYSNGDNYSLDMGDNSNITTNIQVNDLSNFNFILNTDFIWKMEIAAKVENLNYSGVFSCYETQTGVYQTYNISGEKIENPYYFLPYNI